MANLGDISKIKLHNGNVVNIKDATARKQANWNTNNGVKNFATINNFSNTGYYKDVPVDGSLTGNVTVYIGNIISTDTDANKCAVLFMYTDDTSSLIHLVNRGTASSFSANLEAKTLKSVRIYSSDNYVHSSGDTVTVTNLMVCPKSLYDADSTYHPYSLPNTKITPELIELVDSGVKNELELITPYGSGITNNPNLTVTLNADQTITVNGSVTTSGVIVISNTISGKLGKYLSGRPAGVTADIRLAAYSQPNWSTAGNDYNGKGATITDNGNILITIYVIAGQTYSNLTFKPMICSKSAWDVSQKYVPYRPTYEETVKQVAENENNILYLENENSLRNIYPITLAKLKELNTSGTWTDGNGISTYVDGTITYVYNIIDSTITVTGYGTKNLFLSDYITIDNGLYFCTGCPSGGSADTYYIAVNSMGWTAYNDFGDGREIKVQNNQIKLAITIKVNSDNALDGLVFKPMIITNDTRQAGFTSYKPYAPTNRELYLMLNQ